MYLNMGPRVGLSREQITLEERLEKEWQKVREGGEYFSPKLLSRFMAEKKTKKLRAIS